MLCGFFFGAEKKACWWVFFSGAVRRAGGRFSGVEKSAAAIFLHQKRDPDNFWVYLLYIKVFLD